MITFLRRLLAEPRRAARAPAAQSQRPAAQSRPAGQRAPQTSAPQLEQIDRPSGKGQMTGFEPRALRDYHAPISVLAKGVAGLGLFDAEFSARSVYSGQLGEVGFYKALCLSNLIDGFSSYWSVAMPGDDGRAVPDSKFTTDVDCVIVQGDTVYLIDLKYYASGAVTWHSQGDWLLCRDDVTGKQVRDPRRMSRNMAMAKARFAKLLPGKRIEAYVVLIPTNDGIGRVAPGTTWPGDIPLVGLPDMLDRLRRGTVAHADSASDSALTALLKEGSP